jgi:HSP90 family molecular chaperone
MSQPDPRKALAELVQNSLDAGARRIRVTRIRERKIPCLRIYDNGEGVIPEMDRREALQYVATHIGHSRKRSLSPEERMALMTQGQFGIGLLGFWSLGDMLEMRSAVPGQRAHRLVLYRDRSQTTWSSRCGAVCRSRSDGPRWLS